MTNKENEALEKTRLAATIELFKEPKRAMAIFGKTLNAFGCIYHADNQEREELSEEGAGKDLVRYVHFFWHDPSHNMTYVS